MVARLDFLFCFGLGFCARHLAARLAPSWRIEGTGRAPPPTTPPAAGSGPPVVRFDRRSPLSAPRETLAGVSHILVSVPPDAEGDPVLDAHGGDIARLSHLAWLGYLSTTGVYGDTGGAWVDEATPVNPATERARRRVAAEARWLDLWRERGVPVHVFRLAGIYGPGRNVLEQLRAGAARRVDKPGHVFSRIHVDDIARVLEASMNAPDPGAVYNVCDDEPAAQSEVVSYAAGLLGIAPPPLVAADDAELSAMTRSFYGECRRVCNDRIKAALGVTLQFPSYREGLASLAAGEAADLPGDPA